MPKISQLVRCKAKIQSHMYLHSKLMLISKMLFTSPYSLYTFISSFYLTSLTKDLKQFLVIYNTRMHISHKVQGRKTLNSGVGNQWPVEMMKVKKMIIPKQKTNKTTKRRHSKWIQKGSEFSGREGGKENLHESHSSHGKVRRRNGKSYQIIRGVYPVICYCVTDHPKP